MAPILYMKNESPAVRGVLMTAKALGITLKQVSVNLAENEHLSPEFLKINPQHTVPTLVEENGQVIWDSHAIIIYLVEKYGKDDSLYPKDLYKRAVINQRLHFDSGVTFALAKRICMPLVRRVEKTIPRHLVEAVNEAYGFLEKFLEDHQWVAGDEVTVADLSLIPSVMSLDVLVPIDSETFPNVTDWINRAQNLPCYDANQEGLDNFRRLMLSFLKA